MTIPATGKPEDRARANIDRLLTAAGWLIQNRNSINIEAGRGVAIREFHTQPAWLKRRRRAFPENPAAHS